MPLRTRHSQRNGEKSFAILAFMRERAHRHLRSAFAALLMVLRAGSRFSAAA